MKAWKFEAWVAIAALVASSLTAAAAIYQSKVFSDQLQATVWPYLSFVDTYGRTSYLLTLDNNGAGPAIIVSAELTLDGKPQTSFPQLLRKVAGRSSDRTYALSYGSVAPGLVIRPGANILIVRISSPNMVRLRPVYKRVGIVVYYCSLLRHCWRIKMHSEVPADVTGQQLPRATITSD